MAELYKEDPEDPDFKNKKLVSTVGDNSSGAVPISSDIYLPKFKSSDLYKDPTDPKDRDLAAFTGSIGDSFFTPSIAGTSTLSTNAAGYDIFNEINLAKAIPDENERRAYIEEHGSKMVKLLDPDKFGIRFDKDVEGYLNFYERNYNTKQKQFLDELDENQGFLSELGNTTAKLIGRLATGVTGLVPLTYGLFKGLATWDAQNIFNNAPMDAWSDADAWLDKKFVVYGGSEYYEGDKGFFARIATNPMKSINNDVVPAAAFVGSAVLSELAVGALTATTLGATAPAFAANTARLAAQGTALFSRSVKVMRGLDAISDIQKARQIITLTEKFRQGIMLGTGLVRQAGYESSLIARDTYQRTKSDVLARYIDSDPALKNEFENLLRSGLSEKDALAQIEKSIDPAVLDRASYAAEQAGELAWFTNVPLVGFSQMIQLPSIFNKGYRMSQTLARINPLKNPLIGTTIDKATGQLVTKASQAGLAKKIIGYSMVAGKGGVVEGFEEFSQGVIEHGYADYYSSLYSDDATKTSIGFSDAMVKATRSYVNSTEGQDSITIGALMGIIGIGLPVKVDSNTGKVKLGFAWYGGIKESISEFKKAQERDKLTIEKYKETPIQPVLKNNIENMLRSSKLQADMDKALGKKDTFQYKNSEHAYWHSFVSTRYKNGIADTIYQDLDALEEMDINEFNDLYTFKTPDGDFKFDEKTRKAALDKARKSTESIIKSHEDINTMFKDQNLAIDRVINKNYSSLQKKVASFVGEEIAKDPVARAMYIENLTEAAKDQMISLDSSINNLKKREKELEKELSGVTATNIDAKVTDMIKAETIALDKNEKFDFADNTNSIYQAIMEEWRSSDPIGFKENKAKVQEIIKDLIKIKREKARLAAIFDTMFTTKGAEKFIDFYTELENRREEIYTQELIKKAEEELEKAKSSNRAKAAAKDIKSLDPDSEVVDNKIEDEIANVLAAEFSSIFGGAPGVTLNETTKGDVPINTDVIIDALSKSPSLFNAILDYLEAQGTPVSITTVDELQELAVTDPTSLNRILNAFQVISAAQRTNQTNQPSELNYADPQDASQPAPLKTESTSIAEKYGAIVEELHSTSIYQPGSNVSDYATIPITHDKEIVDGAPKRDELSGKFLDKENTDQPVDTKLINDPNFLSNKELRENDIQATFKIADNEFNKTKNPSADNIAINVYYNDVFIGRLPAWKPGMPNHLRELRNAIVKSEVDTEVETTTISVGAVINPELRTQLNQMGYKNSIIDKLTKEEITTIIKEAILPENFVSRNQFIQENFDNIVGELVAATTIPGNPDFEMFTNEDNVFKKC